MCIISLSMKRKSIISLLFIAASLLAGCTTKDEKIYLDYGNYDFSNGYTKLINPELKYNSKIFDYIDYTDPETKEKFDSKKSALILIKYDSLKCSCYDGMKAVLSAYAQKHNVLIHEYDATSAGASEYAAQLGIKKVSLNPMYILVREGKIVLQDIYNGNKRFSDLNAFETYISPKVVLPTKMFFISKDQLDEKYNNKEKFNIYFSRSTCPDCQYIDDNFLINYMKKTKNTGVLYILDCDVNGVRLTDGEVDSAQWQAFKHQYGLSVENNADYGYDTGYVPSFYRINPTGKDSFAASIIDGSVAFNDSIAKQENGKYIVTNSYYTNERKEKLHYLDNVATKVLLGLQLDSSDVDIIPYTIEGQIYEYASWSHAPALKYHAPLLEAFLNKYMSL